jgi:hypothetical protein
MVLLIRSFIEIGTFLTGLHLLSLGVFFYLYTIYIGNELAEFLIA